MPPRITIRVNGRPAPQGSKELGTGGALLESSAYLPAWRQAVRIAAFRAYAEHGILPPALPLYPKRRVVRLEQCVFIVTDEQCRAEGTDEPIGKPDVDKLLRGTLDALGGAARSKHSARLYADDSQVKTIGLLDKIRPIPGVPLYDRPGAVIVIAPADWES
jgi:hypothetical protein